MQNDWVYNECRTKAYGSSLVGEIHLYKAKEKNRSKKIRLRMEVYFPQKTKIDRCFYSMKMAMD